jgi:hypothetical protein
MSITFACGHCGKTFTLDDKFAGKKGKCKQCGSTMQIPDAAQPSPNPTAGSVNREISPSRRAPTQSTAPAPRQEISPSRRAPEPTLPPPPDIFGFDDNPRPGPSVVMDLEEDDFETDAVEERPLSRGGYYDAPKAKQKKKKKKKSGEEPPAMLVGRILLGLAIGSAGTFASLGLITQVQKSLIPGLKSKDETEAIIRERIALNQELATLLASIQDVPAAQAASAQVNQKIRAIAANLRKLRTTTSLKSDVNALNRKYEGQMNQATNQLVQEIVKLVQRPLVFAALNMTASMEELDREEKAANVPQADVSGIPIPGPNQPPVTPPNFNPPRQPGFPNAPNNPNRGGRGRGGMPRSGPGGFGGPG